MQNVDNINKYETTALNCVLAVFTPRVFIESDDVVVSSSTLNKILSIMWIIPLFARILDWMILDCTPFHSSKISVNVRMTYKFKVAKILKFDEYCEGLFFIASLFRIRRRKICLNHSVKTCTQIFKRNVYKLKIKTQTWGCVLAYRNMMTVGQDAIFLPSVSSSSNITLTLRTHSLEFRSPQIARIFSILRDVPLTVCRSNS